MASRLLNRRVLREQADQAAQTEANDGTALLAPEAIPAKTKRKAAAGPPKVRKARAKKLPPKLFAHWGLYDATMKLVSVFAYNQRAVAEQSLADLLAKKKSSAFLQIVKLPLEEPVASPA